MAYDSTWASAHSGSESFRATQKCPLDQYAGLPRRFAPRNDGYYRISVSLAVGGGLAGRQYLADTRSPLRPEGGPPTNPTSLLKLARDLWEGRLRPEWAVRCVGKVFPTYCQPVLSGTLRGTTLKVKRTLIYEASLARRNHQNYVPSGRYPLGLPSPNRISASILQVRQGC